MTTNDRAENLELQGGLAKDIIMPAVETLENAGYEKAPRVFTHAEERKLVRKLDLWYELLTLKYLQSCGLTHHQWQKDRSAHDGHVHASKL